MFSSVYVENMTKKWNLQDIQPANRARRSAKRIERKKTAAEPADESLSVDIHVDNSDAKEAPKQAPQSAGRPVAADVSDEQPEAAAPQMRRRLRRRPTDIESASDEGHFDTVEIVDGTSSRRSSMIIAGVVFIFVVLGGVVASALMGGAEVAVTPRFTEKSVAATFTGSITPQQDTITYELLTLEADGERQVEASGQEEVSEQAEGTILIYNEFSTSPVRLVKNTRFESPAGLIYKIKESAVVPGYTEGDNGIVPGVVTADVFAEAPGERYNVGPSRFTIPGFEGFPEYESVYGESTGDISGGFSGQKFIIDDAELETARQALHTELRDALLERLPGERPAGYVLYDDAVTFTFNSLPAVAYGDNLATIKEQGVLRVPLFQESQFAKFLAEKSVPGYEGLPVRLEDYQALSFSYTTPTTTVSDISAQAEIPFTLTGDIKIIWEFDENELKADLLGVEKTAISQILGKYPAIESAEAVVRPFWQTSFPREMREIEVFEVIE